MAIEYASNGDVITYLRKLRDTGIEIRYRDLEKLITQIVAGVAHSHMKGIVHRDLKGENVFVTENRTPLIADLGIAVNTRDPIIEAKRIRGTLGFIPPENLVSKKGKERGTFKRTTYQGDVFALGVLLYEMLTNHLPFPLPQMNNSELQVDVIGKILAHHNSLLESPPLPSTRSAFSIPPEMEEIIMKALSPNPEDRYKDAIEMLLAVATYKAEAKIEEARTIGSNWKSVLKCADYDQKAWRDAMLDAAKHLEDAVNFDPIEDAVENKLIKVYTDLYKWAHMTGDKKTFYIMEQLREHISRNTQFAVLRKSLSDTIKVRLDHDFRGTNPEGRTITTIFKFKEEGGLLRYEGIHDRVDGLITEPLNLKCGEDGARVTYVIQVEGDGIEKVAIPLPVREGGEYNFRIPIYPKGCFPIVSDHIRQSGFNSLDEMTLRPARPSRRFVIIPAGHAAAPGLSSPAELFTYAAQTKTWRPVNTDFAIRSPLTAEEYYHWLLTEYANTEFIEEHFPKNWHSDVLDMLRSGKPLKQEKFKSINNERLNPSAPVDHILYESALACFDTLFAGFDVSHPTPDQFKLAFRGQRGGGPSGGISKRDWASLYEYDEYGAPSIDALSQTFDICPYSTRGHDHGYRAAVARMVSGVSVFLANDAPERFMPAVRLHSDMADQVRLVGGTAYRDSPPTDLEHIDKIGIGEVGEAGAIPCINLDPVKELLPTMEELRQ
jgi:hypothetical protein